MQLAVENIPKIKDAYKNVLDVATCMNITHPYMEDNISVAAFGKSNSSDGTSVSGDSSNGSQGGSSAASALVGTKTGAVLALVGAALAFLAQIAEHCTQSKPYRL